MPTWRLLRFDDRVSLVEQCAGLLLTAMIERQADNGSVSLCLTGGELANDIYDRLAATAPASALDVGNVHLWWNWDAFVATDNPGRNSLQALSRLGGALPLDPAKIHPIPSSSVAPDPEAGAAQYAQELAEASPIDICLLELGPQGQIAGLCSRHPATGAASLVAGITDASLTEKQIVTMTRSGLNACRDIWILASGDAVASQTRQAIDRDPTLPTSELTGSSSVLWLVDDAAAAQVPFHHCSL